MMGRTTGIASLGMYDFPHLTNANDHLWRLIHHALGYGPAHLTRDMDLWDIWQSPDLLFAQTCSLPFRSKLHDKVQLIGTPDYGLPDCPAGYYNSVIVVHQNADEEKAEELEDQLLAYNDPLSQSGWAAVQTHMARAGVSFLSGPCTGSHAASLRAIVQGDADFAAIDALSWALLQVHDPKTTAQLRVIDITEPTPALPYITSASQDLTAIQNAVTQAIAALPKETGAALHLRGIVQVPIESYLTLPIPNAP